jgi:IclR family pca regulon transcriptional regulator
MGKKTGAMTNSQIASAASLDRWATRRILHTLEAFGYVSKNGNSFHLTPRILNLGYAYLSSLDIWQVANPLIEKLVDSIRLSCSIAVLDGSDIVYVARVPSKRNLAVPLSVGSRMPAYCTACGRVLLAYLSEEHFEVCMRNSQLEKRTPFTITERDDLKEKLAEVKRKGWCMVDQELEEGIRSIAVPIRDRQNRVGAAMSLAGYITRVELDPQKM